MRHYRGPARSPPPSPIATTNRAAADTILCLSCQIFSLYTVSKSIGAGVETRSQFQLGAMFGVGRWVGIEKTILISLTSEDKRARPHMGTTVTLSEDPF